MKIFLIYIFKISLKIIYFFLKMLPTNKKKIVFISRQSNEINIDFKMLRDEIKKRNKNIKMVFICKRIDKGLKNKISFLFTTLKQMYHLATSKIAVIDSYCIPVCILKHKKTLTVLQIWHSIGKIKKSGYQTLGKEAGRDRKIAKIMCMHKNYDKILAGGLAFDEFYEKGFNVDKNKLLHYGLPRIDYLMQNEKRLKKDIYKKYPEFKNKKVVYYVPTFRPYDAKGLDNIMKYYNPEDFILIVRGHPNQELKIDKTKVYECSEFKSTELLSISDYVITDYSSICLEAAILNKKVLFYTYDYEKYLEYNGINLDANKVIPTCSSSKIKDLLEIIKKDKYDMKAYQDFRKKYLPKKLGNSTSQIVDYIFKNL